MQKSRWSQRLAVVFFLLFPFFFLTHNFYPFSDAFTIFFFFFDEFEFCSSYYYRTESCWICIFRFDLDSFLLVACSLFSQRSINTSVSILRDTWSSTFSRAHIQGALRHQNDWIIRLLNNKQTDTPQAGLFWVGKDIPHQNKQVRRWTVKPAGLHFFYFCDCSWNKSGLGESFHL